MQRKSFSRISIVAMVACGLVAAGASTLARSDNAGSHNGLQGAWRLQVTVRDCQTGEAQRTFPALFTFATGGTLTVTTAGQPPSLATPGLGVWRHTGDHTYSAVSEAFVFDTAGAWTQTHRLTRVINLSDQKDQFTDTVSLQIFDVNGNLIVTGCATSVASRFE
jgi:hypothetical protein